MELNQDFKEFIQLLNSNKVEYLVVGGYAVATHGFPRYTGDMDFWIKRDKKNAQRVVKALLQFGFGKLDVAEKDFLQKDFVIQLGFPPSRIDIMTGVTGLSFRDCWKERKIIKVEEEPINFISLHHLKINKKLTGRGQDKNDLKNLP